MMEIALMFNPFGKKEKQKRMGILHAQATQEHNKGMDRINNSGNAKPVDDILAEAGQAVVKIIKDSIKDPAMDGTKEQMLINKLYDLFRAEAKKREEERADRMNKTVPPDEITPPKNKDGDLKKFSQPIVTSLQRIGGAAINSGKVDVERTLSSNRNKILTDVRDRIKEGNDKLDGIKGVGGKPKVEVPKVEVPKVEVPKLEVPKVEVPRVEVPKVEVPRVEVPKVEVPRVEVPKVEVPRVEVPKVEVPRVEVPKVEVPRVEVPKVAVAPQAGMVASFMEGLRGLSSSMSMDGMMNLTREGNGILRSIDVKMGQQRGAVYV